MKRIESTQNAMIKELAKLHRKKERDRQRRYLIEGEHMLQEAAQAGALQEIFFLEGEPLPDFADRHMAVECTAPVLNRLSLLDSGARLIGVASLPDQKLPEKPDRVLLLDGVQDPGNLGTLIRSAVGFGIQLVLCSGDCADPFGPKALQSSQGAVFHVPVIRCRLSAAVEELKTRMPVFAAALHHDSISLSSLRISGPWALVLGNEGQGIQEALINQCTETVYIEMDAFESLNVAVAGSILMYCLRYRTERDNP